MKLTPLAMVVIVAFALLTAVPHAQAPFAAGTANPELVGPLAKELGATPKQAEGPRVRSSAWQRASSARRTGRKLLVRFRG